ncbi:hypothetical protein Pcinc_002156 [Petrolisthes cinctipes]|uniref:Uncharacterized protein n=1 Tax=Petrolisthes cinctipes TaxID=88211 RepID=A0AAE1L2H7_PETCI|nr:hypothetical protein Pcinc_002156 [Petrolisthes cinctipes]
MRKSDTYNNHVCVMRVDGFSFNQIDTRINVDSQIYSCHPSPSFLRNVEQRAIALIREHEGETILSEHERDKALLGEHEEEAISREHEGGAFLGEHKQARVFLREHKRAESFLREHKRAEAFLRENKQAEAFLREHEQAEAFLRDHKQALEVLLEHEAPTPPPPHMYLPKWTPIEGLASRRRRDEGYQQYPQVITFKWSR